MAAVHLSELELIYHNLTSFKENATWFKLNEYTLKGSNSTSLDLVYYGLCIP